MFDVVVVGSRCAGASLAMLLARRGRRVALIDRARFPSDTISTHFLWQGGAALLDSWGLLERLRALGCTPMPALTFDFGSVLISGHPPPVRGVQDTFCPRRTVFDKMLIDAAVEAGVELFEGSVVEAIGWSEGRAAGVHMRSRTGTSTKLGARIVVGADGRHSFVSRQVQARSDWSAPPMTFVYYSYWSGLSTRVPTYHLRPGRLILRWPTNDGLTCLYVGRPQAEFRDFRADIEGSFLRSLAAVDGLAEEVKAGRREERFRGAADLVNFRRQPFGPGWALVGDAAFHQDPATGFGMWEALRSADLLAGALEEVLSAARPWQPALEAYQRAWDAATERSLHLTLDAAALRPLPQHLRRYFRTIADQPDEVTRIIGALGGAIPTREVFPTERVGMPGGDSQADGRPAKGDPSRAASTGLC